MKNSKIPENRVPDMLDNLGSVKAVQLRHPEMSIPM